jgi:hypothetical protein
MRKSDDADQVVPVFVAEGADAPEICEAIQEIRFRITKGAAPGKVIAIPAQDDEPEINTRLVGEGGRLLAVAAVGWVPVSWERLVDGGFFVPERVLRSLDSRALEGDGVKAMVVLGFGDPVSELRFLPVRGDLVPGLSHPKSD